MPRPNSSWLLLGLVALASLQLALADTAPEPADVTYYKWDKVKNTTINGVYPKCRVYWIRHAQVRQFTVQAKQCPFGPFAADIVDHTVQDPANVHIDGYDCGKWIEGNSGQRGAAKNPMLHGEIEAITRMMDCTLHPEYCDANGNQLHAQDKPLFGHLTMYSTGESCLMDAAAESYAGFGEVVFGVFTKTYMDAGWPLFPQTSKSIYDSALTPTRPKIVIQGVDAPTLNNYYVWQYNTSALCPVGCARSANGASCIADPTQNIPADYLLSLPLA